MREAIFQTRITDLLGIRHPILCGGMGPRVSDARYVAAVVNAGGMGFIVAAGHESRDAFVDQLRLCRKLTGGKPFGVNFYVSRRPGSVEALLALIPLLAEHGVNCVETAGANPEDLIQPLRDAGIRIIHKAPGVRYALTAQRMGVDAVIVVGYECGGHPGTKLIGSMVQAAHAPQAIDIPVVIAGGIGTGRQLAAALAMGADAILMGTRMLVAEELWIHPDHKARLAAADGTESVIIKTLLRDHHRVLDNPGARAVLALEAEGITEYEAYSDLISGAHTYAGYRSGNIEKGTYDWGQSAIFAGETMPVAAIFDELLDDAVAATDRMRELCAWM
ncbi:2-nitropropane dioxygenase [Sphingobium sp. LB126]|uniref:NAD(P)H-dependent flavin oxidoreductase n=1 Tax=Sphingobium sp. LB126 TaxID=1983755 RepID=UPI000C2051BA|nr:nitronate monooxygenase [Sphingobium sp. LB126]PJG46102.1 2-nitropropane dioxygenase [Sphingobium sp. LB126]